MTIVNRETEERGRAPRRGERGDAALLAVLMLVAVVGLIAAANSTSLTNMVHSLQRKRASDTATLGNASNISLAPPLFQFPADQTWTALNPFEVPALYPSPYLIGGKANTNAQLETIAGGGGPWSLNAPTSFNLFGYDARPYPGSVFDTVFNNVTPQNPINLQHNVKSVLSLMRVVPDPTKTTVQTMIFRSNVNTVPMAMDGTFNSVNASNTFTVEVPIQKPPPPSCVFRDINNALLPANGGVYNVPPGKNPFVPGTVFKIGVQCFGLTTSVTVEGVPVPIPPDGASGSDSPNDIKNTVMGGFALPAQTFTALNPANGYGGTYVSWGGGYPDFGYMTLHVIANGPGGSTTDTAWVSVYNPIVCNFLDANGNPVAPGGVYNPGNPYPRGTPFTLTLTALGYAGPGGSASITPGGAIGLPAAASNVMYPGRYNIWQSGETAKNNLDGWPWYFSVGGVGYMVFSALISGPGNPPPYANEGCSILVEIYAPATCAFTANPYSIGNGTNTVNLQMVGGGGPASAAEIFDPNPYVSDGINDTNDWSAQQWVGGWSFNLSPKRDVNHLGTSYWYDMTNGGRVTGPGNGPGVWTYCSTAVTFNWNECFQWETNQFVPLWACTLQCVFGQPGCPITGLWTWFTFFDDGSSEYCDGFSFNNSACSTSGCALTDPFTGACLVADADGIRIRGCFAPDTRITLADGSAKRVDQLTSDDKIYDPVRRAATRIKNIVKGPEKKPLIEVWMDGQSLHVTDKHPMITRDGLKAAGALSPDDWLLGEDGEFHAIQRLVRVPGDIDVYNFETEADGADPAGDTEGRFVIANGIVTGDLIMQKALQKELDAEQTGDAASP